MSNEVCLDFNLGRGACGGRGPCGRNRQHICAVCGKNHRGKDAHHYNDIYKALGKDAPKGAGKKGKDRKGKGKGKKNDGKDTVPADTR